MKSLLQGVVKDHRLPQDYKMVYAQPMTTKTFFGALKKSIMNRMITKQYATLPVFCFFGIALPWFFFQSYLRYKQTGSLPQTLQPQYYLYRNNLGLYGYQHNANANPDNFYNRMGNCWTSDPMCGLDVGPKRPWIDLKDPTKNLFKFKRDAEENQHVKANGWRGY